MDRATARLLRHARDGAQRARDPGRARARRHADARASRRSTIAEVAEPYIRRRAMRHLEKGRVVMFAAGTGNPFFTTDTGAALRACEIGAQAILMGKNGVDGVYDADPAHRRPTRASCPRSRTARRSSAQLRVMDATALSLCMENDMPIHVFNIDDAANIGRIVRGEHIGTVVATGRPRGTRCPARGRLPAGRRTRDDDRRVGRGREAPHGQDDRVDAPRVQRRAHRPGLGGAARPHPGVLLRHQDAAQPARADQRARAAAAHRSRRTTRARSRTSSAPSWSPTSASTPRTTAS